MERLESSQQVSDVMIANDKLAESQHNVEDQTLNQNTSYRQTSDITTITSSSPSQAITIDSQDLSAPKTMDVAVPKI